MPYLVFVFCMENENMCGHMMLEAFYSLVKRLHLHLWPSETEENQLFIETVAKKNIHPDDATPPTTNRAYKIPKNKNIFY